MNVRGNAMMTQVAEELDVPFRRCGAMVLCFDESERPGLQALYDRGARNGVEGLRILTGEEARAMEPNLSDAVCAALYCPSSGIVCPFELTLGFAENAAENGAEFRFESGVTAISRAGDHYCIETEKGLVEARAVVNAAGVYACLLYTSGSVFVTSAPSSSTVPLSGTSRPEMMRSVVVLPQPEEPSSVMNSPGSTFRSMPFKTGTPPKAFLIPFSSRISSIFTSQLPYSLFPYQCIVYQFGIRPILVPIIGQTPHSVNVFAENLAPAVQRGALHGAHNFLL